MATISFEVPGDAADEFLQMQQDTRWIVIGRKIIDGDDDSYILKIELAQDSSAVDPTTNTILSAIDAIQADISRLLEQRTTQPKTSGRSVVSFDPTDTRL